MLARGEGEPAMTAAEASHATGAIVIEARAATGAALADRDSGHPGAGTFLRVRLSRLARAAEEAIAAARDGDTAGLCRALHRFEALTSAIWTAQHAVCGPASPAGNDTGSRSSSDRQGSRNSRTPIAGRMSAELGTQPVPSTMQARLHAAERDAGDIGDLPVAASLDVGQIRNDPLPTRQRPHCRREIGIQLAADHLVFGRANP